MHKERRIINYGGAYVIDPKTGDEVMVDDLPPEEREKVRAQMMPLTERMRRALREVKS